MTIGQLDISLARIIPKTTNFQRIQAEQSLTNKFTQTALKTKNNMFFAKIIKNVRRPSFAHKFHLSIIEV